MEEALRTILEELRVLQEGQERLDGQRADMEDVIGLIKRSLVRMELTDGTKIAASLDGVAVNDEAIRRLEHRVAWLEKEVGRQAMKLVAAQLVNG